VVWQLPEKPRLLIPGQRIRLTRIGHLEQLGLRWMLEPGEAHIIQPFRGGEVQNVSHRRILLRDLMAYKQKVDADRNAALEELTRQAEDLNMGY
jgi:hypothetical protein